MASAHEIVGLSDYRLGLYKQAVAALRTAQDLHDNPALLPVIADCRRRAQGRWAAVDQVWQEIKAASPSQEVMAEGRIVAAGALADQGDLRGAIALMEPATKRPKVVREFHVRQWYVLGDLYDRVGDPIAARRWFRRRCRVRRRLRRRVVAASRSRPLTLRYPRHRWRVRVSAGVVAPSRTPEVSSWHSNAVMWRARGSSRRVASMSVKQRSGRSGESSRRRPDSGLTMSTWSPEYPDWVVYEFPDQIRSAGKRLGQAQRWFLFRVRSDDVVPRPDDVEVVAWRWVTPEWLLEQVVDFRLDAYRTVLPRLLA